MRVNAGTDWEATLVDAGFLRAVHHRQYAACMAVLPVLIRAGAVALGSTVAGVGYASFVERNAFVLRELTLPVLTPGSTPLRVLHLSDLHMVPNQRRKQAWLRELA